MMENGVSVDDFRQPGNSVNSAAACDYAALLPPVTSQISLWWVALDRPCDDWLEIAGALSAEERARAERFGTELLKQRWIAGRATLRLLLGRVLGIAPASVPLTRGRRGRPELAAAPIDFNVSHTQGMALIAIADVASKKMRIGVDVEHREREVNADGLSRKFLSESERAGMAAMAPEQRRHRFLRLWTCKEAMSKATGDALAAPFRHLEVSIDSGLKLVAGPTPYLPRDWALHSAGVPEGFLATVAIWRSAPTNDTGSP
jgi:4'-phosphopantetheinyl transferase